MPSIKLRAALGTAALLAALSASAQEPPPDPSATGPLESPHVLDEYNVDFAGTSQSARVGVGITYGDVFKNRLYWNKGFRLSWLQYNGDRLPKTAGYGVGATFGFGWDPSRVISPASSLTFTFPLDIHDRVKLEWGVTAGARVRLTSSATEQFAVTFAAYYAAILGGGQVPDRARPGLAVLFSSALFAPK